MFQAGPLYARIPSDPARRAMRFKPRASLMRPNRSFEVTAGYLSRESVDLSVFTALQLGHAADVRPETLRGALRRFLDSYTAQRPLEFGTPYRVTVRGESGAAERMLVTLGRNRFDLPAARGSEQATVTLSHAMFEQIRPIYKKPVEAMMRGGEVLVPLRDHVEATKGPGNHAIQIDLSKNASIASLKILLQAIAKAAADAHDAPAEHYAYAKAHSFDFGKIAASFERPSIGMAVEKNGRVQPAHRAPASPGYRGRDKMRIWSRVDDEMKTVTSVFLLDQPPYGASARGKRKP